MKHYLFISDNILSKLFEKSKNKKNYFNSKDTVDCMFASNQTL